MEKEKIILLKNLLGDSYYDELSDDKNQKVNAIKEIIDKYLDSNNAIYNFFYTYITSPEYFSKEVESLMELSKNKKEYDRVIMYNNNKSTAYILADNNDCIKELKEDKPMVNVDFVSKYNDKAACNTETFICKELDKKRNVDTTSFTTYTYNKENNNLKEYVQINVSPKTELIEHMISTSFYYKNFDKKSLLYYGKETEMYVDNGVILYLHYNVIYARTINDEIICINREIDNTFRSDIDTSSDIEPRCKINGTDIAVEYGTSDYFDKKDDRFIPVKEVYKITATGKLFLKNNLFIDKNNTTKYELLNGGNISYEDSLLKGKEYKVSGITNIVTPETFGYGSYNNEFRFKLGALFDSIYYSNTGNKYIVHNLLSKVSIDDDIEYNIEYDEYDNIKHVENFDDYVSYNRVDYNNYIVIESLSDLAFLTKEPNWFYSITIIDKNTNGIVYNYKALAMDNKN